MNQQDIDKLEMLIRRNYLVRHHKENSGNIDGIVICKGETIIEFENGSVSIEVESMKDFGSFQVYDISSGGWKYAQQYIDEYNLQVDSQVSERFHDSLEVDSHYDKEKGWTVGRKAMYYNSKGWRQTLGEAEWFKSYDDMIAHMTKRSINVRSSASFTYMLIPGDMMVVVINGIADTNIVKNVNSDDEAKVIIYNKYGVRL